MLVLTDDAVRAASLIVSASALVELVEEVRRLGGASGRGSVVQTWREPDGND